ncbi:Hypothetical predicted protein [Pelobates cultripes]|uniref:Uncharacterized protein n=1 Tax=Pelobates cultripes TaxID=61616 RepID=A0AAD1WGH9_PELCU|nr:Hypothetical predicted protein [Pelobates cultripes]
MNRKSEEAQVTWVKRVASQGGRARIRNTECCKITFGLSGTQDCGNISLSMGANPTQSQGLSGSGKCECELPTFI